jgi:hypothetical protein
MKGRISQLEPLLKKSKSQQSNSFPQYSIVNLKD